ncbi:MAG: cytochrome c-type biosis protein [Blastocatellia bacterium]|jgi:cytochrome c-type biogenesis protein|nr:cytochrome c-type biosis protein [Blastocatellia bacterium]
MQGSNITIGIAFLAGLASFLSPCVLPLVPGYISLMSGVSIDRLKEGGSRSSARRAVIFNSLAFNAGLSIIFLALGATAGWLGSAVLSNPWVRIIGGLVIIAFGLHLIGLLKITALYRDTRKFSDEKPRGMLGSLTLGIAFAAGWTPCIGPILGGIIGLAATSGGWKGGLVLSAFYSAGLALPFLVTGLAINQFLGFYSKFRQHLHKVEVVSGVVLILIGLLVASGYSTLLASSKLAAIMPNAENWIRTPAVVPSANTGATQPASSFPVAPDVEFQTLDGKPYRLADLRGHVVLLNFWATWCIPCRAEIPEFNAMQRDLKAQGLEVVGVSTSPTDSVDVIKEFQKDISQEYTVLRGGEGLSEKFGNGPGLPVTHIIDREGRLREKLIGQRDRTVFENLIKPLLSEAPPTARR